MENNKKTIKNGVITWCLLLLMFCLFLAPPHGEMLYSLSSFSRAAACLQEVESQKLLFNHM